MEWTLYQFLIILFFICVGTLNTILLKFANVQESEGIDGETRLFHHPFVQTSFQSTGMSLCWFIFKIVYYHFKRKDETLVDEHILTRGNRHFNIAVMLLPACLDISGSSCITIGIVLTHVSSLQMLRSSIILFTAILSYFAFKRVPNWRECFGILLVTSGLVLVGLADYLDKGESTDTEDTFSVILGDCMAVLGSFLTACQVVLEEKYLKSKDIPPLQAVGWEGMFGFLILVILQIILYFIPAEPPMGRNSRGTVEDSPEGFVQMYNNWRIAVCMIAFIFTAASYNFCGLTVSKELSSTTRKVVDSVRIIPIWVVSVFVFGQKFQYLQLVGFLILVLGEGFYNDIGCTTMRRKMCPRESDRIIDEEPADSAKKGV